MNLQGRDLSVNIVGDDVALLHRELRHLRFRILAAEINRKRFGRTTRRAVLEFQNRHGLQPTGVVDEPTARRINAEVEARPPERFVVRGQVRLEDGSPLEGLIVRVVDRDLRREQELDKKRTDRKGLYEITYTPDQFRRAEKRNADLKVRAFSAAGLLLAESDILFNARPVEKIDLVVVPREEPRLSEYELLVANLTPLLEGVPLPELNEDDLVFLVKETGLNRQHVAFLIESAQLSVETDLRTEAFYGWARGRLLLGVRVPSRSDP